MDFTINWKPFQVKFCGEVVSMSLRPLKSTAYLKLAPFFDSAIPLKPGETPAQYAERLTPEQRVQAQENSIKMQALARDIFPEHVEDVQGITINGGPPSFELLAEEIVFMPLVAEIFNELMIRSAVAGKDEKNCAGPSASAKSEDAAVNL